VQDFKDRKDLNKKIFQTVAKVSLLSTASIRSLGPTQFHIQGGGGGLEPVSLGLERSKVQI
jgi:hypothetical protein